MKKSREIIGTPVFAIVNGKEIGQVRDLIINPEEGAVEYLLVSGDEWYLGAMVLSYRSVLGVGAHAVTTESQTQLTSLEVTPEALTLLQKRVRIVGTKVLTRTGDFIGVVSEYGVDEANGKVISIEFTELEGEGEPTVVSADRVLTFGSDVLVVEEVHNQTGLAPEVPPAQDTEASIDTSQPVTERPRESEAARLFVERQKQFLLGKRVAGDIRNEAGDILIAEGTEITEMVLESADRHGKLMELSQNIRQ